MDPASLAARHPGHRVWVLSPLLEDSVLFRISLWLPTRTYAEPVRVPRCPAYRLSLETEWKLLVLRLQVASTRRQQVDVSQVFEIREVAFVDQQEEAWPRPEHPWATWRLPPAEEQQPIRAAEGRALAETLRQVQRQGTALEDVQIFTDLQQGFPILGPPPQPEVWNVNTHHTWRTRPRDWRRLLESSWTRPGLQVACAC